ncbi:MAG TPA: invasion associated locus B family protein [Geminicoccus sp.]|jgi:invasion protein IalB|uniref:invasion associated locus B family protein n=1 Tax=Geminicoccus sp. TaxID=2024832 RepID=UPI002E3811F2|nr:invasion associated locus B family protein [Geminicoccus sp.]HEX2529124.1 invasion associated locus B family protein [Geminicoccus sp.]
MKALAAVVLSLAAFVPTFAEAAPKLLSNHRDWNLYVVEGDEKLCYIASEPKKQEGTYKSRGNPFIIVARIPSNPPIDEVSVRTGYAYKKDSEVSVRIDGTAFSFFTNDEQAWAKSAEDDKAAIAAMRRGREALVQATSTRDTKSSDTYSLSGFSDAYSALAAACGKSASLAVPGPLRG